MRETGADMTIIDLIDMLPDQETLWVCGNPSIPTMTPIPVRFLGVTRNVLFVAASREAAAKYMDLLHYDLQEAPRADVVKWLLDGNAHLFDKGLLSGVAVATDDSLDVSFRIGSMWVQ